MRKIRAFTLIELLMAFSIFSAVALSIYSTLRAGILTYNKTDYAFGVYQTARLFFNRIELDLKDSFNYYDSDSKFKGDIQNLEFFSVTDIFEEGVSNPNISYIRYNLNNTGLKRLSFRGLDALKGDADTGSEDSYPNIKKIAFQYAYSVQDANKPYDWQDTWPLENNENQKKSLPLAVKIELSVDDKVFTKVISLPRPG